LSLVIYLTKTRRDEIPLPSSTEEKRRDLTPELS